MAISRAVKFAAMSHFVIVISSDKLARSALCSEL